MTRPTPILVFRMSKVLKCVSFLIRKFPRLILAFAFPVFKDEQQRPISGPKIKVAWNANLDSEIGPVIVTPKLELCCDVAKTKAKYGMRERDSSLAQCRSRFEPNSNNASHFTGILSCCLLMSFLAAIPPNPAIIGWGIAQLLFHSIWQPYTLLLLEAIILKLYFAELSGAV